MKKEHAFSLTELMIVLVVVAVLFAAIAPIFTKRRNGGNMADEAVWNYVSDNDQLDAYYNPGPSKWTSTAYIGIKPIMSNITSTTPRAKVVLNAKQKQNMIQFRYGSSGSAATAGTLFIDDKNNILLSHYNKSFVQSGNANSMTVAGPAAFQRRYGGYSVAFGAQALRGTTNTDAKYSRLRILQLNARFNAVGAGAAMNVLSDNNFTNLNVIGAFAGQFEGSPDNNISIGAFSSSSQNYYGKQNIHIGYNVGNGAYAETNTNPPSVLQNNVIVGSKFVGYMASDTNYPKNNVFIGKGAYENSSQNVSGMTAVGYGACSSFGGVSVGPRTCIGYKSGSAQNATPSAFQSDATERIFLGGVPQPVAASGGFAGRGVVEVHNASGTFYSKGYEGEINKNTVFGNPSVVLNSNLVVRGNFFTSQNNGLLQSLNLGEVGKTHCSTVVAGVSDKCFCSSDKYFRVFGKKWYWCTNPLHTQEAESSSQLKYAGNGNAWPACGLSSTNKYPTGSGCLDLKTSDIRLKENITEKNTGLDEILALKPYKYYFKSDKNKTLQVGVIAQDLQKTFKNSVKSGIDGYLRIRWDEMFYSMINAIKTLDKKVEKLTADISEMEINVKTLKTDHKDLHRKVVSLNARAAKLEKQMNRSKNEI